MKKVLLQIIILFTCVVINNVEAQWVRAGGSSATYFNAYGNKLFAGGGNVNEGLYSSNDSGKTWNLVNQNYFTAFTPELITVQAITVMGSRIFASFYGVNLRSNIFSSDDSGKTWLPATANGLTGIRIPFLISNETHLFAGINTLTHSIYSSIDNGSNWEIADSGLPVNPNFANVLALTSSGTTVFVGYDYPTLVSSSEPFHGIYRSVNNVSSWVPADTGLPINTPVTAIHICEGKIYAGTFKSPYPGGLYMSSNNGSTWTNISSNLPSTINPSSIAVKGANIFLSTQNDGIFLSKDNGLSWAVVDTTGLPSGIKCYSNLLIWNDNLIVKSVPSGIYRRNLSEMLGTTSIHSKIKTVSNAKPFSIKYNSNKFSYVIKSNCFIDFRIYNLEGKLIEILEKCMKKPGMYSVPVGNKNMPTGVYTYIFQTNGAELKEYGCFIIKKP